MPSRLVHCALTIGNQIPYPSNDVEYLGVWLNRSLSWSKQIGVFCCKGLPISAGFLLLEGNSKY